MTPASNGDTEHDGHREPDAPAKRALVICSGWDPVPAMRNTTACAEQMLRAQGFEVQRCFGDTATRQGILDAYDRLIAASGPDDAAVVFYTGHGNLVVNSQYTVDAELPSSFRNICPTDFGETVDGDFRGISSYELSLQLAALTAKTRNATVILECCYSAQMSRGGAPTPSPKLTRVGVTAHLQQLRARIKTLAVQGNPDAIRIAAAGEDEAARFVQLPERDALAAIGLHDLAGGEPIGAMTLALAGILAQTRGLRVPWRTIAQLLRDRLVVQRPEIEGPSTRLPFSLERVDAVSFTVRRDDRGALLEAGALLGISTGDVYGVMPPGSTQIVPDELIATVTIDDVTAVDSRASQIAWCNGHAELPSAAIALAMSAAGSAYAVRIVAAAAATPVIEARLRATRRLRSARTPDEPVLGTIRVDQTTLELSDELGPLMAAAPYPDQLDDAIDHLANLATAKRLRGLDPRGIAEAEVTVAVGIVDPDGAFRAIDDGHALGLGDRIAIRIANTSQRPLWANVFGVGLRGAIARLDGEGSGVPLPANQTVQLGDHASGCLTGFALGWPSGLPRDQPRKDTIMTVVTARPADLSVLETTRESARSRTRSSRDALERTSFAVLWRDYLLHPIDGSLDLGAIELDADPHDEPPAEDRLTSVTLAQLEPTAPVRLDVLVVARPDDGAAYQATTARATGDLIAWRGRARAPLDVYAWASDPRRDAPPLAALLAARSLAGTLDPLSHPGSRLARGASLRLAATARAALGSPRTVFRGSFGSATSCRFSIADIAFTLAIR